MIKIELKKYIEQQLKENQDSAIIEPNQIKLYQEEKDYLEKHTSIVDELAQNVTFIEADSLSRFMDDVYIERCNKETEEFIAEESANFLDQPIHYFLEHIDEFMYLESPWFAIIGVDAISFEVDSVFKTYDVMLGLKLQKKFASQIKTYLTSTLKGEEVRFSAMFNANEGIWDLNFSLNDLASFKSDWTIREAYSAVYHFLFRLGENIENAS
jgi:hypothetical protein